MKAWINGFPIVAEVKNRMEEYLFYMQLQKYFVGIQVITETIQ